MVFYCENNYYQTRPLYGFGALANQHGGLNPCYPFYAAFSTNALGGGPIPIPYGFTWPSYGWINYE